MCVRTGRRRRRVGSGGFVVYVAEYKVLISYAARQVRRARRMYTTRIHVRFVANILRIRLQSANPGSEYRFWKFENRDLTGW